MMTSEGDPHSAMPLIRRIQPTSDETPPWAGMSFIQPVDSDALHEHLKAAYPECTTFRERKHMAAIDFLQAELRQMQAKDLTFIANEHSTDGPALPSPQARSPFSETFRGRSRKGSASLSQSSVSSIQIPTSMGRALHDRHSPTISAGLSPVEPPTEDFGQHIVFSAVDGRMLKPKTKRRMTLEEKNAYKETRKRGACPRCKRQKGRCTHVIDLVDEPGLVQEMKNEPKRKFSRDASLDYTDPSKTAKLKHQSDAHRLTSNLSQQQQSPAFRGSLTVENDVGDSSNQPSIASGDTQWGQDSREPDRLGIPRYVNHQAVMEPYGISLPRDTGSEWTGFPTPASVHTFNPEYIDYVEDPGHTEGMYPLTSPHDNIRPDFSYSSEYTGHQTWTGDQEPHPRIANPD